MLNNIIIEISKKKKLKIVGKLGHVLDTVRKSSLPTILLR
jgi:hypothetical protein